MTLNSAESLLLIALLRTLWRLSPREMSHWLRAWPALALTCGLRARADGQPWVPSPSQQWKRAAQAGAPPCATIFVLTVREAIRQRVIGRGTSSSTAPPSKHGGGPPLMLLTALPPRTI